MLAVGGTFTVMVKVPVWPGCRVPKLHDTVPALPTPGSVQVPPFGLTALNVVFRLLPVMGSTAVTVLLLVATPVLLV